MVMRVAGKHMAFLATGLPPRRPGLAQAAIARLGALVRRKKAHAHLVATQHLGDQGRHTHVTGVQGQIDRLALA